MELFLEQRLFSPSHGHNKEYHHIVIPDLVQLSNTPFFSPFLRLLQYMTGWDGENMVEMQCSDWQRTSNWILEGNTAPAIWHSGWNNKNTIHEWIQVPQVFSLSYDMTLWVVWLDIFETLEDIEREPVCSFTPPYRCISRQGKTGFW